MELSTSSSVSKVKPSTSSSATASRNANDGARACNNMGPNKHDLIRALKLQPHIEGGLFRRTFSSSSSVHRPSDQKKRLTLSSIYYLITDDHRVSYMVENKSDIIRFFHSGSPITYYVVSPDGELTKFILGSDIHNGHVPQFATVGGSWLGAVLERGEYGLLSEAVAPGFEYEDMKMVRREDVERKFPHLVDRIGHLLR